MENFIGIVELLLGIIIAILGTWMFGAKSDLEKEDSMLKREIVALRDSLADKVDKNDQQRIDDSLKGELAALRSDISHLRDQQHEDSMAVVRSISELQNTVSTTLGTAIASAVAQAIKIREG